MAAALTFLEANNVAVPEATAELYDALIGIAERRVTKADLAGILRRLGV